MSLETITVTLSTIGIDAGPFIVKDEFLNSYSGVSRSSLLAGYANVFNNETSKFEITSSGVCTNKYQIDIVRQNAYVYFTNDFGSVAPGGRGALFWFSVNDYYTTNNPGGVIASNCLNTTNLGTTPNPSFAASISYWQNNTFNTLDDGSGGIRAADGSKIIYINDVTYPLAYNPTYGYWGRTGDIFTITEGATIAAIKINSVTTAVANNGVGNRYFYVLPNPTKFIRTAQGISSGFSAGSTGVTFFDLS